MLHELARHFSARTSFSFETTLSGRGYLRLIRQWQAAGYRVKLISLQLASAEEAIARVAQRVRQVVTISPRPSCVVVSPQARTISNGSMAAGGRLGPV